MTFPLIIQLIVWLCRLCKWTCSIPRFMQQSSTSLELEFSSKSAGQLLISCFHLLAFVGFSHSVLQSSVRSLTDIFLNYSSLHLFTLRPGYVTLKWKSTICAQIKLQSQYCIEFSLCYQSSIGMLAFYITRTVFLLQTLVLVLHENLMKQSRTIMWH